MRPLSLTMTAFGPFAGSETIRFAELGENPLFLINGPTGSGKTTILDAICFALYGKTTGDEREGAQMRCDLAGSDILTELIFEFELAGRSFRIRRMPEQQRPKARGEGTTTQAPEAQMYELLAEGKENLIVASKVSEATREIEELTGLSVEQFRQVMVLPQGKFRQLLMADSSEREKIFSQLFQTRIYKRLEENLKVKAAEIRREREGLGNVTRGILEGAELLSVDELELELTDLEPVTATALENKQASERLSVAAGQDYEQAKLVADNFERLAKANLELAALQQRADEIDAVRRRLQEADKALRLQPLFSEWQRCEREFGKAQRNAESCVDQQKSANQTLDTHKLTLETLKPLQIKLDEAKQQAIRLEDFRTRVDGLKQARTAMAGVERQIAQTQLHLSYKQLADRQLRSQQREQLQARCDQQQKLLSAKEQQGRKLKDSFEQQERQTKALELTWHQGQAAVLAAELENGLPCPVCGSCAHPAPAHSDQPLPNQQDIEQARDDLRQTSERLEKEREAFREAQHMLRDLQREMAQFVDSLTEPELTATEFEQEFIGLQGAATELGMGLDDLRQVQLAGLDGFQTAAETAMISLASARADLVTAEREVPEAYREAGVLERELQSSQGVISATEREISGINQAYQQAERQAEAAQVAAQLAAAQVMESGTGLETARQTYGSALQASPFADDEQYQRALLDETGYAAHKRQIDEHDGARQRLGGICDQLQEQLSKKERPDLDKLAAGRASAEAAKTQAVENWRQLDKRLSRLLDTRRQLQKTAAERAELDRQYAIIGTLSDVANGQTGNKVSLQRFVLSVLLDDVLVEASQRLSLMSKGRYQLLRKEDRAKGNKASGLELEVEDAYTGKVRPVATLSGGESFMAALSLALGLSDVVQAYAGGIRLDTLFIDEGFGSLDAESLDLAIRTLVDLQSTGRMIGIISHVAELKEQLALRIDVFSGREGSSLRVVTP